LGEEIAAEASFEVLANPLIIPEEPMNLVGMLNLPGTCLKPLEG